MILMIYKFRAWVWNIYASWRYTPEQRKQVVAESRMNLKRAYLNVKEAFESEPESRELMETFRKMDKTMEDIEKDDKHLPAS